MKRFLIRLFNYEYWPMWAFYLPLLFYFLWRGLANRQLFYFTNVNNGMDAFGGLFFDSKSQVDGYIPKELRPKTVLIHPEEYQEDSFKNFKFPLIVKPDQGERGRAVVKVHSEAELSNILAFANEALLIQDYINFPLEYGVFISFIPEINRFKILSLTEKKFFSITGDGTSTVKQLIYKQKRGLVLYDKIIKLSIVSYDFIPKSGETIILHTHGNHSKGTEFINANSKITEAMHDNFNSLLQRIKVFDYGRFDLKVNSLKDLETFENISIIEFNGLAAEPTTVYDQNTGYLQSLRVFIQHWKYLERLSLYKKTIGIQAVPFKNTMIKILDRFYK